MIDRTQLAIIETVSLMASIIEDLDMDGRSKTGDLVALKQQVRHLRKHVSDAVRETVK